MPYSFPQRVVLITAPGLAAALVREVRDAFSLDAEPVAAAPASWVATRVERPERLVEIVYLSRIAQRVLLETASARIRQDRGGLEDIEDAVSAADLTPFFGEATRFAVRCDRRGRQAFTSIEAAARAGGAVQARARAQTGSTPGVDLDDPDLVLRLEILDDRALLGVDLSAPRSLHRRGYLRRPHRAGLKPTLATGLLDLAGWTPGETLLDPMCGGGTIVLEAALRMAGVPAGFLRRDGFPFRRMPLFGGVDVDAIYARHDAAIDRGRVHGLTGADISSTTLDAARDNARSAGIEGGIEWIRAAIGELPRVVGGRRFRRVVTNPPYGIRMGSAVEIDRTYRGLIRALDRTLDPEGAAVVLTPRERQVRALAARRGFDVRCHRLGAGSLEVGAFVLRRATPPPPP